MPTIHPALCFLLGAAVALAEPDMKKSPVMSLLPDGSHLDDVLLPRYDENLRLSASLRAARLTLVNEQSIAGDDLVIEFYNPDQSPRGRIDLKQATVYQDKALIESREPVSLISDQLCAQGSALHYDYADGVGFLTGPTRTWLKADTMKTTMLPKQGGSNAAMFGLFGNLLIAAPPVLEDGKSNQPSTHSTSLIADLDASAAATARVRDFVEKARIEGPADAAAPMPAPDKPLEIEPAATDTVVNCDGGMYFDSENGVFVYLKNVRVSDPRFALSGANELKIFLTKQAAKAKPGKQDGLGIGAKFGEVDKIVATGAVRILQRGVQNGKEPVEASGALFTYRPSSGDIVISGGYPWVKQGANFLRAKEPDLILRLNQSGSFETKGKWEMGGRPEQTRE
jgi:hypothetical protein